MLTSVFVYTGWYRKVKHSLDVWFRLVRDYLVDAGYALAGFNLARLATVNIAWHD